MGNAKDLSKKTIVGEDEKKEEEQEFNIIGSLDRQARIRELLRKQEQLLKQAQMTNATRAEIV